MMARGLGGFTRWHRVALAIGVAQRGHLLCGGMRVLMARTAVMCRVELLLHRLLGLLHRLVGLCRVIMEPC